MRRLLTGRNGLTSKVELQRLVRRRQELRIECMFPWNPEER